MVFRSSWFACSLAVSAWLASAGARADVQPDVQAYWKGEGRRVIQRELESICSCRTEIIPFSEGSISDLPAQLLRIHYEDRKEAGNVRGDVYYLASYQPTERGAEAREGAFWRPQWVRTLFALKGDPRYVTGDVRGRRFESRPGTGGKSFLDVARNWGYTGKFPKFPRQTGE